MSDQVRQLHDIKERFERRELIHQRKETQWIEKENRMIDEIVRLNTELIWATDELIRTNMLLEGIKEIARVGVSSVHRSANPKT